MFLLPRVGRCIDIGEVQPAGTRQKNPGRVAGNLRETRIVAVDGAAIRYCLMCDRHAIRRKQTTHGLVVLDCRARILLGERTLTRGANKGREKNEVPAQPNSHQKLPAAEIVAMAFASRTLSEAAG